MKKGYWFAAVAALLAGAATAQQAQEVRLAYVGAMEGAIAHYSRDGLNGARMAVDEINAKKPVIGGRPVRFDLLVEDDAADPIRAVVTARKVCAAAPAAVIGHLTSATTVPVAEIYADCAVPLISPFATAFALTPPENRNTWRLVADDIALGVALGVYTADRMSLKTVAVVHAAAQNPPRELTEVFLEAARERGMKVVSEQAVGKAGWQPVVSELINQDPDAVLFTGMDVQLAEFLAEMDRQQISRPRVLVGDGVCTPALETKAAGSTALNRVVCVDAVTPVGRLEQGAAWKQRYDARFPGQYQLYSPYAYDSVMIVYEAMRRANSTDPKVYAKHLAQTSHRGVTGEIVFEPNGAVKNPAVRLALYRKGHKSLLN